jgi:cathepsin X
MAKVIIVVLLLVALANAGCYLPHKGNYREHIVNPRIPKPLSENPAELLWNNKDGVNYLTAAKNQHIPQYCGSCWIMAGTSVLSDRIKIMNNAAWPDINLSPQVILSCDNAGENLGCNGGTSIIAYEWIKANGITDETCSPYQARGWNNGLNCSDEIRCKNCSPSAGCNVPESYNVYTVTEYGKIAGEELMIDQL